MNARAYKTKSIRPLSSTRSQGHIISPTKELRRLKEGRFIIVDDNASRHHMINAAHRLNIAVITRKNGKGYEIHRVAKSAPAVLEYPV